MNNGKEVVAIKKVLQDKRFKVGGVGGVGGGGGGGGVDRSFFCGSLWVGKRERFS